MTFALAPNFTSTYPGVNVRLAKCLNSVFNVKPVVAAFNKEKALVGAFSVIVQLCRVVVISSILHPELCTQLVTGQRGDVLV